MFKQLGAVMCFASLSIAQANVVLINQERGKYELDFSATYQTYINQDIETAVILPPGYKFVASMPGSRDFVSAGPLQNTMYISCPVDHEVLTNLTMHVITPEGAEEKLIFKLTSRKSAPKVLAIEFEKPNNSALNRTVEAVKARYTEQMNEKLMQQETNLDASIHKGTLINERHFFINGRRGAIRNEYKEASFTIDGMINSRGNTYIYLRTENNKDGCDIIKLLWVSDKNKKDSGVNAEFVAINENDDGTHTYVYAVPEISIPKTGNSKKITMCASIWSKKIIFSFCAS